MTGTWPLGWSIAIFAVAALVIAFVGTRMAAVADMLADRTGAGEALVGAVLLGGSTSLSGIITSATAAASGLPELALSNAVGGITVQTAILALGDMTYRKVNLEHAAASLSNLLNASLLVALLALPLAARFSPDFTWWGINYMSPLILIAYGFGLRLVHRAREEPMWRATKTEETRRDEPGQDSGKGPSTGGLWARFALFAVLLAASGWAIARSGASISSATGLSQGVVGTLFTAVATSLPELVTTLTAVRRGALTLAVGGIVGGNTFDTLFIPVSDAAYRQGSLYHAAGPDSLFQLAVAVVMTALLSLGLLRREKHGIANIGFESALIVVVYAASIAVLFLR